MSPANDAGVWERRQDWSIWRGGGGGGEGLAAKRAGGVDGGVGKPAREGPGAVVVAVVTMALLTSRQRCGAAWRM